MRRKARTRTILALGGVLALLVSAASAQTVQWYRQFGSFLPEDDTAQAVDADGNIYVAGWVDGTLPGQPGFSGRDGFLRKYDCEGNELWTRQFDPDNPRAVAVDGTGVYVAGSWSLEAFVRKYDANGNELWHLNLGAENSFMNAAGIAADETCGLVVVGTVDGNLTGTGPSLGGFDAWARKLDPGTGTSLWTQRFGSSSTDEALAVVADPTGFYVGGKTSGALPGQVSSGGVDLFIRKYDCAGNELWTSQVGTAGADDGAALAVEVTAVYLGGAVAGTLPGQVSAGGLDAFLRKYDATNGNVVWTRQFGSSGTDQATSLAADSTGVYVGGLAGAALPGQTALGSLDAFIRRYDAGGNDQWTRQFGTSGSDRATGITASSMCIVVVGQVSDALPGQDFSGLLDVFVREYDPAGSEQWTRQFGTNDLGGQDEAAAAASDGSAYVVGAVNGLILGSGVTGTNGGDGYLRKYDAAGNEIWTRQFGTVLDCQSEDVSVDGTGVYVSGLATGAFTAEGQVSSGGQDAFVRKFDSNGNHLWTRQFGSTAHDTAPALVAVPGGVLVAGTVTGGALPGQMSAGGSDSYVRLYDAGGTVMWTRQFGTFGNDAATDMAAGSMGIVVVGQTNQVFPGETNAGGRDVFVRFYDMTGTVMWTRQFGTAMDDSPTGVAIDSTGIYVVGNTATTFLSAFVRKYDAMGNALWATPYSSSFPPDEANDVAVTSGGVLIAGGGGFPVDAYVRKVSPTGAEVWRVQFGSTRTDRAFGVSACSAAVYVAGFTQGTLPTQTNSGGVLDAFLVQIVDATVPSNQQPVCNAGGPYIPSGRSAALDAATVSDGDGDELTYRWTSSDPNVSISPETGTIPAGFGPRTVPVAIASLTPGVGCSGSTTVTLTVDDGRCGVSTCQATVVFRDSEPPSVSCSVDLRLLDRLWPPDHDLANVGLNIVATDNCDLQGSLTTVVSVFADEEDEEPTGDGTHSPDARDVASGTMRLRAERRGDGDGRVYLIQVGVTDSSGNVGWCCCTVVVPRSNSPADVESVRVQADAARAHFEGTRLAPPGFHVVGDGPVIGPRQ